MSFDKLASAISNSEHLLGKHIARIRESGTDGEDFVQVSDCLRRMACGSLLIELDTQAFSDYLYCSGRAYLDLLLACESDQVDSYYRWRSRGRPLFDAIAIRATTLLEEISRHSSSECVIAEGEPEGDFWYHYLLSELSASPGGAPEYERVLASFEKSAGDSRSRLLVSTALCERDGAGFADAFQGFLYDWRAEVEEARSAGTLDPYDSATTAHICVEGLALLRVAEQCGLAIESEYPNIPDVAIAFRASAFPEDFTLR